MMTHPAPSSVELPAWRVRPYLVILAALGCCLGILPLMESRGNGSTSAVGQTGPATVVAGPVARFATTFGIVEANAPVPIRGVSARQLAGQSHGIAGNGPPSWHLVQVLLTVRNERDRGARLHTNQLRLVVGRSAATRNRLLVVRPRAGWLVRLEPRASVTITLSYLLPRSGARLTLELQEPRRRPVGELLGSRDGRYRPQPGDASTHSSHTHMGEHGPHRALDWGQ